MRTCAALGQSTTSTRSPGEEAPSTSSGCTTRPLPGSTTLSPWQSRSRIRPCGTPIAMAAATSNFAGSGGM
eukprot:5229486-Prymnesium_polylepis.1